MYVGILAACANDYFSQLVSANLEESEIFFTVACHQIAKKSLIWLLVYLLTLVVA